MTVDVCVCTEKTELCVFSQRAHEGDRDSDSGKGDRFGHDAWTARVSPSSLFLGPRVSEVRLDKGPGLSIRSKAWIGRFCSGRAGEGAEGARRCALAAPRSFWARLVRPAPHGSRGEGQQGPAEAEAGFALRAFFAPHKFTDFWEVLQAPSQASQALEVLVYGYHPVLIEPISALLQFQASASGPRFCPPLGRPPPGCEGLRGPTSAEVVRLSFGAEGF